MIEDRRIFFFENLVSTLSLFFFWVLFWCFVEKILGFMMDLVKSKEKKSSIIKKFVKSVSFPKGKSAKSALIFLSRSRSYPCTQSKNSSSSSSSSKITRNQKSVNVTPNGCFSVYVGAEKQRFVMKAKYANHPLFKMLLEDAETEYGFNTNGPLLLPCDVNLFYKVLAEIDNKNEEEIHQQMGCGGGSSSCSPFSPARRLGSSSTMSKGYSAFGLLTPPRLLKINHHF